MTSNHRYPDKYRLSITQKRRLHLPDTFCVIGGVIGGRSTDSPRLAIHGDIPTPEQMDVARLHIAHCQPISLMFRDPERALDCYRKLLPLVQARAVNDGQESVHD